MTKNNIHNIFYFLSIFSGIDNKLINTSPDYLIEKSLSFFNNLGKNVFISDIKSIPFSQRKNNNKIIDDFWFTYCRTWNVNQEDYKIMNIINFIFNSDIVNSTKTMKSFDKYIDVININTDTDLSFKIHPNLIKYINKNADLNSRYLKLRMIEQK